jgi:transcription antitermination factor NusG
MTGAFHEDLSNAAPMAGRLPWFALHVQTRYEAGVSAHLQGMGYQDFLPLCRTRTRWSDRTKKVDTPLFPGYLFCRFDPQYRLPILKTPGVIQIVGSRKQPIPVEENEIEAIQAAAGSGTPCQPYPYLQVGETVQIESGPLRGLEGILVEVRGNRHLILSVTLLQRSVAVKVEAGVVRCARCVGRLV